MCAYPYLSRNFVLPTFLKVLKDIFTLIIALVNVLAEIVQVWYNVNVQIHTKINTICRICTGAVLKLALATIDSVNSLINLIRLHLIS